MEIKKRGRKISRSKKSSVRRLYRASEKDSMIGGVCAGVADYFEIDPVLTRLFMVFLIMIGLGTGILVYIIAWVIIPRK